MPPLRNNTAQSDHFPAILDGDPADRAHSRLPQGAPCTSCGAPIERADRYCVTCGHGHQPASPGARESEGAVWPEPEKAPLPAQKRFQCKNCGSEVATDPDQRSYTCPFCDSNYVVELPAQSGRRAPEFIIGFGVTPEQAEAHFRQWIGDNAWFRPGDLKGTQLADKIRGVYLPFWGFSMLAQSSWNAGIGEYWWRTETYTTTDSKGKTVTRTRQVRETEWWPLSGRHHRYYSGYLVSGSRGLAQAEADRIKPYHLPALKRYEPFYLAGWSCEEYSVAHDAALEICQHEFMHRERQNVERFLPGDTYRDLDVRITFSHINSDLCLLPAYVLTYMYKDKRFRFLVNGQTGKVAGEKPLSTTRIAIVAVVVALVIIALLVLVGILSSP